MYVKYLAKVEALGMSLLVLPLLEHIYPALTLCPFPESVTHTGIDKNFILIFFGVLFLLFYFAPIQYESLYMYR
jgi:hypothetical protein